MKAFDILYIIWFNYGNFGLKINNFHTLGPKLQNAFGAPLFVEIFSEDTKNVVGEHKIREISM